MTIKTDGGPAFPMPDYLDIEGSRVWGISQRDWFAAQALTGLCANPGGPFQANPLNGWGMVNCTGEDIAYMAYLLADAMLEARVRS